MRHIAAEFGVRAVDHRQQLVSVMRRVAGRDAVADCGAAAHSVILLQRRGGSTRAAGWWRWWRPGRHVRRDVHLEHLHRHRLQKHLRRLCLELLAVRVEALVQLAATHQLRAVVVERDEVVGALNRTARVGKCTLRGKNSSAFPYISHTSPKCEKMSPPKMYRK